jgi:hypothetical protein
MGSPGPVGHAPRSALHVRAREPALITASEDSCPRFDLLLECVTAKLHRHCPPLGHKRTLRHDATLSAFALESEHWPKQFMTTRPSASDYASRRVRLVRRKQSRLRQSRSTRRDLFPKRYAPAGGIRQRNCEIFWRLPHHDPSVSISILNSTSRLIPPYPPKIGSLEESSHSNIRAEGNQFRSSEPNALKVWLETHFRLDTHFSSQRNDSSDAAIRDCRATLRLHNRAETIRVVAIQAPPARRNRRARRANRETSR